MGQNTSTTNSNQLTNQVANQTGSSSFNTTTARDPYAPIVPYLNAGLNQSAALYQASSPLASSGGAFTGAGGSPFTAVPNDWVNAGLYNNANFANALGAADQTGTLAGTTAATSPYFTALNRYNNPIDSQTQDLLGQFNNVYGSATNYDPLVGNLSGLAANTTGALTPTQQAILDQNAERLSNRLASQYSGAGRYGSFGAGIGLARGISETNNPLIAQFNQSNIQNALNANQMSGGLLGQQGSQRLNATGGAGNLYNTAQARAQQYGGMLPTFAQLGLLPGNILRETGGYQLNYPWQLLQNSINTTAPMYPLFGNAGITTATGSANNSSITNTTGNTTGTATTARPTPWTTYAGLGIAGLGLL